MVLKSRRSLGKSIGRPLFPCLLLHGAAFSQQPSAASLLEKLRSATEQRDLARIAEAVPAVTTNHSLVPGRAALDLLGSALDQAQQAHDTRLEAMTLHALGQIEYDIGQNTEAVQHLQRALPLAQGVTMPAEETGIRITLGAVYGFIGQPDRGLAVLAPAVAATGDANLHANALTRRAEIFSVTGKLRQALTDTNEALNLERQAGLPLPMADTLIVQGNALNNRSKTTEAMAALNEALAKSRDLADRRDEGRALNFLGESAFGTSDLSKALDLWKQALAIEREVGDRPDEATTLHDIGAYYYQTADPRRAIEFYEQGQAIQQAILDFGNEAATFNDLGNAYVRLRELSKAIVSLDHALTIERAVGNITLEAITLHSEAELYQDIAQAAKSMDLYRRSLALERKVGSSHAEGVTLSNLAGLYQDQKRYSLALQSYRAALQIQRNEKDPRTEAVTRHNIGTVYLQTGQQATARAYFNQALVLERKGKDLDKEGYTRWRLAMLGAQSVTGYLQALQLAQQVGDVDLAGRIEASLMVYYRDHGSIVTAIFFGKRAVNHFQQLRFSLKDFGEAVQDTFVESRGDTYRDLARLLIREDRFPEAEQVIALLKKQEHAEFARGDGGPSASGAPVALTPAEDTAASVTADEMQWLTLKAMREARTPEQQAQYAALDAKLSATNLSFSRSMQTLLATAGIHRNPMVETIGLQQILRQLRERSPKTVGVYTLVSEKELDLIVVTGTLRLPPRKIAISRDELTNKVRNMRWSLQDPCSDPKPAALEMYKLLIAPILADLRGAQAETIVWELDGALRYIPMSALYDGHHYLVETYRTAIFNASQQSGLVAESLGGNWSGLGFGSSEPHGEMQPLPSVVSELRGIFTDKRDRESNGPIPGPIHLNGEFSQEMLSKELDTGYPIVHIASHFVLMPGSDQSYLVLGKEEPGKPGSGRLTYAAMRDDPSFRFDSVELLTLSACQTGTSPAAHPQDGAEVDALGDLAAARGAKAVMATLWSVNDASTGDFMTEFYKDWTTGNSTPKAEALRKAQSDMLRHGAADSRLACGASLKHPYFWAPFILIGNWQ